MSHPEHAPAPEPAPHVQFIDSLVPTLTAGRYELTAHQSLTRDGRRVDTDNYLDTPVTQRMEVSAPRFSLQPEWVHGAYPTPGAGGLYDDVLPHVTLDRATLPWEREAGERGGTRLPWLALLVFGEGELPDTDPHCLGRTDARTVAELAGAESGVVLPPFDRTADPLTEDDERQTCRTVLVPAAVFHAVAPSEAELPLLTHVRRVEAEHPRAVPADGPAGPGDHAVIVGNRLPRAAGGRYVAHLVSLEGWRSRLPDGSEGAYAGPAEKLRLISLWSWAFETIPDHTPGFAALTGHFVDSEGTGGSALLLRVPLPDRPLSGEDQQEVADRLGQGYLPVSCRTESGRATFGWYRGPFTAQYVAPETDRERRRCAAEALIHLEQHGIFDVSLATAFTAGRGVALADHQFAAALTRLRGAVRRAAEERSRATAPAGSRARIEHLAANGLAGHLGELLTTPAGGEGDGAAGRRGIPGSTPVPAATDLPVTAGLTPERLRADPELYARLTTDGTPLVDPADDDLTLVRNRLLDLRNLRGVPFAHLVPDARMLPAESLRFFHVDANWTAMLLDGALSVGLAHTFDFTSHDLIFGPEGVAPLPEPAAPVTGLLLRSELVSGWPALEVGPYPNPRATEGETALRVLRREALADDVLLVLVEGVPGRVELTEPQQGVHFGIDEPAEGGSDDPVDDGVIRLREIDPASTTPLGQETGAQFPTPPGLRSFLRTPGTGGPDTVLSVSRLAEGLKGALRLDRPLTPGEFALQMINAAQRRTFSSAATARTPFTTGEHPHG